VAHVIDGCKSSSVHAALLLPAPSIETLNVLFQAPKLPSSLQMTSTKPPEPVVSHKKVGDTQCHAEAAQ